MEERAAGGRFAPGVSGNPGGRPRMSDELRAKFQALSEKTLPVLEKALEDSDPRIRLEAARIIADRAWGRPHSTSDVTLEAQDPMEAHLAALVDLVAKRSAPDDDTPVN